MDQRPYRTLVSLICTFLVIVFVVACTSPATPTTAPEETTAVQPTSPAAEASEPPATQAPVQLSVWLLGNSGPGVDNALPGFEAKYPNIKVDVQVFGWNDLLPKLQAALTAGSGAPDVVEIFTNQMPVFVDTGAFTPLNNRIEPYKNDLASFAFLDVTDAKGNIYGIAWSVTPSLLFYRSDIFQKEGVDPTSLKTWDDLITTGNKVTHDGQYMFLTASQSTQPQYFNYFVGMLSELNGSLFDAQGNITINDNDRALRVLQTMEAISKAKISMDVDAWWTPAFEAALKSGNVASIVSGAFHVDILKQTAPDAKGLWRVQLAPTFKDGKPTGIFTSGGRALAIPTQSKNADAAWNFIQYMMLTPEGIQATWEGGAILPTYKPAFDASFFDKPDPYYGDEPVGRVVMDGLKLLDGQEWHSGPIPSGVMANEIVGPQLRSLMLGEIDAQTALDNILKDMKARMP